MPTSARAVRTVFTEICGEFFGSLRADVGIGPYKRLQKTNRADRVVRPYRVQCVDTDGRVFPK